MDPRCKEESTIKAMQSALKLVLENPDKETADFIAAAQKQYDGEYYVVFLSMLHHTRSHT